MLEDDLHGRNAEALSSHDVLHALDLQHLAADQTSCAAPAGCCHGKDQCEQTACFKNQRHQDNDDEVGDRIKNLNDTHEDCVDHAAEVCGDTAVDTSDDRSDDGTGKTDDHRNASAFPYAGKQVTAELVGAEPVSRAGESILSCLIDFLEAVAREAGADNTHDCENQKDEERDKRCLVLLKAAPCIGHIADSGARDTFGFALVDADYSKLFFCDIFHDEPPVDYSAPIRIRGSTSV